MDPFSLAHSSSAGQAAVPGKALQPLADGEEGDEVDGEEEEEEMADFRSPKAMAEKLPASASASWTASKGKLTAEATEASEARAQSAAGRVHHMVPVWQSIVAYLYTPGTL